MLIARGGIAYPTGSGKRCVAAPFHQPRPSNRMETDLAGSVLTLNAGSSSLKFALFDAGTLAPVLRGAITGIDGDAKLAVAGSAATRCWARGVGFGTLVTDLLALAHDHAGPAGIVAVGHRIVQGGPDHIAPARVTPAVLAALDKLVTLDPLHLPHNLVPIHAIAAASPTMAQVVCFDTQFHQTMPAVARTVALPVAITGRMISRYGFHGLSYDYVARRLKQTAPEIADARVIVAHLGAGASLCAMHRGASVATTMGFSTLDGLMMATRCGSLDPGVILHLMREGRGVGEIEDILYRRSGLIGVSGISGDMQVLLASDTDKARAAIDLFTYRIAAEIGALGSALGGIDALVFTAGIGEHSPAIRAMVGARLAWLGVRIDAALNGAGQDRISQPASAIDVRVIATDEEAMIAHHVRAVIDG